MRVKIITNGHQYCEIVEGEVLYWCSAVERYDGKPLQVPAVLIDTGERTEDHAHHTVDDVDRDRWTVVVALFIDAFDDGWS